MENAQRVTKVVWRRFREFVLLQDCLRNNNPGCILPPLPPPTIHRKMALPVSERSGSSQQSVSPSRELLERRQVLLQRYLDNLLAHQQLQSDPALWLFVESERFPEMIGEFRLAEKSPEATAPVEAIKDPQFYQDDVCTEAAHCQRLMMARR